MSLEKKKLSRLFKVLLSLLASLVFWLASILLPPATSGIAIPGLEMSVGFLVWLSSLLLSAIFLLHALALVLLFGERLTDKFVRRLGINEEKPSKRILKEVICIIAVLLIVAAISPFLKAIEKLGDELTAVTTFIALGIIVILIYDIGRGIINETERKLLP